MERLAVFYNKKFNCFRKRYTIEISFAGIGLVFW